MKLFPGIVCIHVSITLTENIPSELRNRKLKFVEIKTMMMIKIRIRVSLQVVLKLENISYTITKGKQHYAQLVL